MAGTPTLQPFPGGCCQYEGIGPQTGEDICFDINPGLICPVIGNAVEAGFSEIQSCNMGTGLCEFAPRNVPTLSECGLIAMAGVLGIIGFMILRRKKATA